MSEALPDFRLVRPDSPGQAANALISEPNARLCAGGTDLIVNMRRGLVEVETLVDLSAIAALQTLDLEPTCLRIGAGVTLRQLAEHSGLNGPYRAIAEAARNVAAPGHRQAATLGGNLCQDTRCLYYNQSHWWRKSNGYCLKYRGDTCHVAPRGNRCRAAYCGDMAPALLVLDAAVEITGPDSARRMPLADLYREDGADYLTLKQGEILTSVHVPARQGDSRYGKIRVRGTTDFPLAGVAVACVVGAEGALWFRLAVTGTNSMPLDVEIPNPLGKNDNPDTFFADMEKRVQKAVSPQRTSTIEPHYRRLSVSALAVRLARAMT